MKNTFLNMRTAARQWLAVWASALLLLIVAAPAHSQLMLGPDGRVNSIAQGADGTRYFGGDFTRWGPL